MFKLLRKVRKRLLAQGKTERYLGYAIGEIILVVIGILIALQINTWNQERIQRGYEKDYLERFLVDIKRDSTLTAITMRLLEGKEEHMLSLKKILDVKRVPMNDSIMFILRGSTSLGTDMPNARLLGTYQEIISSGHLRLIRNKELRTSILKYYTRWDHTNTRISNKESNYLFIVYKLFDFGNYDDDNYSFFQDNPWYEGKKFYEVLQDYDVEKEFKMSFIHEMNYMRRAKRLIDERMEEVETLKSQVQEELERL